MAGTNGDALNAVAHSAAGASGPNVSLPSLAPLVDSVKAAVVNVDVQSRVKSPALSDGSDLFDRFFGFQAPRGRRQREAPPQIRQGAGSGFIIHPNGTVLTNNHVVEGADAIRVRLEDGRSFDANVLGRDPLTDVAVVKLKGKVENLPVVPLGDSDSMKVGDWVLAIGNPFGLASSVSAGIISARARQIGAGPYDDFLQTDAAINPGNSGGPLFNLKGEVIGINTAIVGGGTGIGFAVPSNIAKVLLPQLEKGQKIRRGWLGVVVQDLTPELAKSLNVSVAHGALVSDVTQDSPAEKAGLKPDDVVVAMDGASVDSSRALTRGVGFKAPGSDVTLTVYRGGGKKQDVKVKLGERPPEDELGTGFGGQGEESAPSKSDKLGLAFEDAQQVQGAPSKKGAIITNVDPGSAADHADLRPGMVVIEAGGKPVNNARDLNRILRDAKSGSDLLVRVQVPNGKILRALPIP
ncbi:MAG TPA: Do family serine endopeptidase [Myxococcaceae bacterium]|nr:Do family serine endopeptidase [Myxococcaceae bacterium]